MPSQTATGTIALQVEDSNDNCPTLLSAAQLVCSDVPGVNITAEDADAHPNGAPLQFLVIPEETKGKWSVKKTSGEFHTFKYSTRHGKHAMLCIFIMSLLTRLLRCSSRTGARGEFVAWLLQSHYGNQRSAGPGMSRQTSPSIRSVHLLKRRDMQLL